MNTLQDVFISYGRADSKQFAKTLNDRLTALNYVVWFDFDNIPLGVDYQKQIDDGIEKADNFIFIIAPHAINSPYCALEIELALRRNKRIIPILHVEEISQETWQQRNPQGTEEQWEVYKAAGKHSSFPNMHPEISKINWVYFREGQDDFDQGLQGLLEVVERHKDYVHQHTLLLNQALEWERHQKQTQYLLVGKARQAAQAWLQIHFETEQAPCVPTDLHCELITESIKNANNMMTQVFLAYAHSERDAMVRVRRFLQRQGITVWSSDGDIGMGEVWQQAIDQAIEGADNFIYLLSPAAVQSPHCQHELDRARALHKRIIPLCIQAMDLALVPSKLQALQFIDLPEIYPDNLGSDRDSERDLGSNRDSGVETKAQEQLQASPLLKILQEERAYYQRHKVLLTKALKWDRRDRNPSLLLRGYNLNQAKVWLKTAATRTQHQPLTLHQEFLEASLQQPPGVSLDVFISYSRQDSDFARRLNEALQIQGKRTWFDQESIASGVDFQQEIHRGIETSDHFLFVISPRSIASPYCADEVEFAQSLNKRIITVLWQPVDVADLHPVLAAIQWIDFSQAEQDFQAKFRELVRVLETDRTYLQTHTRLLVRAIEWQEAERRESLLLRGEDLAIAEAWLKENTRKQPQPTGLQRDYVGTSRSVEAARQQATEILYQAARKARRWAFRGSLIGVVGLGIALGAGLFANQRIQQVEQAQQLLLVTSKVERLGNTAIKFSEFSPLEALLMAVDAGQQLKQLMGDASLKTYPVVSPLLALQQVQDQIQEQNQFNGHENSEIWSVAFSPDGQYIVSGSGDGTGQLWDLQGQELAEFQDHQGGVTSVTFSPDGQHIVSGSNDSTVRLWDLQGQELAKFQGHQGEVTSVAFSPNGQHIVSGSNDSTVQLWDLQGQELAKFQGHQGGVTSVAFSPNGQHIVSGSNDSTVQLWDLQGQELAKFQGHQGGVTSVAFSPDGQHIVSGSNDRTVQLWGLQGQELAKFQGHQDGVTSVAFSPDGQQIVSGSDDDTLRLWDLQGQELTKFQGHGWVRSVAFSPNGQHIVSGSEDRTVRLWDLQDKQRAKFQGHEDVVSSVAFSPDGQHIVNGSDDGMVWLWDSQGQELAKFQGHEDGVTSVAFSPDGQYIVSGSGDHTVRLWDLQGQELAKFQGHGDVVTSVAFGPDGQRILSGSRDRTMRLWDLQGQELAKFQGHANWVNSVAFSPNGQHIASGSDDITVRLWDLQGQELAKFQDHANWVSSVAFSSDGEHIVSGSSDRTVRLWDLQGQELAKFQGHANWVSSVAFSPDGEYIVSGAGDGTVRLWDLQGNELAKFQGHADWVRSVAFSPDGHHIVSGSQDHTIRLWPVRDLDQLLAGACDWLHDYLSNNPTVSDRDRALCDLPPRSLESISSQRDKPWLENRKTGEWGQIFLSRFYL
jgi:WD40 repeat protein